MKRPTFSLFFFCLCMASHAQFSLIKDINPGSATSNICYLTTISNTLFFGADDGVHGMEIWKSDGTGVGTVLIKDINEGAASSSIGYLTNVNGILFFVANDGINGTELWKTDGTAAGTSLVKDISSGFMGSNPFDLLNVNGVLYFAADDGVNGTELWKSDGTAAGTVIVRNIKSGSESGNVQFLAQLNGKVFFAADNGNNGVELWKSNGTSQGTTMVKDIRTGSTGSNPMFLTSAGSLIYFIADNGISGVELWKTDGTANGTVIIKDILTGSGSSNPFNLKSINDQLFFTANNGINGNELWKSDGNNSGTVLVKDIWPGAPDGTTGQFSQLVNSLVFTANDGVTGDKTWQSDGSNVGTKISTVLNVNNGLMKELEETQTKIFASIDQTGTGNELWAVNFSAVLPLDILSFSGNDLSGTIKLEWSAESFNNSKYFVVEKSANGRDFHEIGKVTASKSPGRNQYNYEDVGANQNGTGYLYYRLRQVDVFERAVYSQILRFTTSQNLELSVYPNPAKEKISLTFSLDRDQAIRYTLFDISGRTIMKSDQSLAKGIHSVPIDISQYNSGVYFITFTTETESSQLRFVKQ